MELEKGSYIYGPYVINSKNELSNWKTGELLISENDFSDTVSFKYIAGGYNTQDQHNARYYWFDSKKHISDLLVMKTTESFEGDVYEIAVYGSDSSIIMPFTNISELFDINFMSELYRIDFASTPDVQYLDDGIISFSDKFFYSIYDNNVVYNGVNDKYANCDEFSIISHADGIVRFIGNSGSVYDLNFNTTLVEYTFHELINGLVQNFYADDSGLTFSLYDDSNLYFLPSDSDNNMDSTIIKTYDFETDNYKSLKYIQTTDKYVLIYILNVNDREYIAVLNHQTGELCYGPEPAEINYYKIYKDYLLSNDRIINLTTGEETSLDSSLSLSGEKICGHYLLTDDNTLIDLDGDITKQITFNEMLENLQ